MDNIFGNQGKKISWVQIIFLLCIVLLAICAFQFLHTDYNSASAPKTAIVLFIVGVATIIVSAIKKSTIKGGMWLLADGAATTVLSVLLLTGKESSVYFAIWEVALGTFKIAESFQLKQEISDEHLGFLYIGAAEILSGIGFLLRSADSIKGSEIAIVISLAIQMSAYALRYYLYAAIAED